MPAGATPAPRNPQTNKRTIGDWEFNYTGWKQPLQDPTLFRQGATKDNLFPESRRGKLDKDLLKKMGLTKERMQDRDALFFYQLLRPIGDPSKSGVEGDPRKPYYVNVSRYSTKYAMSVKEFDGIYSNEFRATNPEELLNWDGMVARNVNDFIGDCYVESQSNTFDEVVAGTMNLRRFLDIKRVLKLCAYDKEIKRGEPGFDPTIKYRLAWDTLVYNLNQFIEEAEADLTVDETTWANESFGPMQGNIKGKPGISKGGE